MGIYYFYVNDSKRCYFPIDPCNVEIKGSFIGRNIGSRALHFLMMENDSESTGTPDHPLIGSWIGDRVYLTGDDYSRTFDETETDYENCAQSVMEMLAISSPWDFIHDVSAEWLLSLIENGNEFVKITPAMATSMVQAYEEEHKCYPDGDIARFIHGLKKFV